MSEPATIRALHIFGCMHRGGAEMRTLEVMPRIRELGVQFDFCTLGEATGALDDDIRALGGTIHHCPLAGGRLSFVRRLKQLLLDNPYDIVHGHIHLASAMALKAAHQAGVPGKVLHFRAVTDVQSQSPIRRLYRWKMRRLADRYADLVLSVSESAIMAAWGPNWREDPRTQVIYNGLDLSRFTPPPEGYREQFGLPSGSKIVAHVGRFMPQKDHDTLIRAAKIVCQKEPRAFFLLAGRGDLRPKIQQLAQDLGLISNVKFLGVRDDIPQLLQAADCTALPSLWEGLPGVVLESIAAGTPIVASDIDSVREIAQHSNLIHCVPVKSPDTLAAEILRVLNGPPTTDTLQFPNIFDLERCVSKWNAAYRRILPHTQSEGHETASKGRS